MSKLLSLLFFLLISHTCWSTFVFSDNCQKAYTHIFNLEYDEAEYLIKIEKLYHPANPSILFLQSGISFMKSVLEEDPEAIKLFHDQHEKLISELNKISDNQTTRDWILAESYFHSALVNFKTGSYLQGAWQLRKSYKTASKENNLLSLKISGLTEAFLSTVPDNYQWVLKIFGMNGDLKSGTDKLYKIYNNSKEQKEYNFIKPELAFHLAYVEGTLLNNLNNSLRIISENKTELSGPAGIYIQSSILIKAGKSKEAEALLEKEIHLNNSHPFPYLIYMAGITKLRNLNYEAEIYFNKYTREFKGNHFIKAAHQKLAWIFILKNDYENFQNKLKDVLNKGSKETDEDRQAFMQAESKEVPDINLLKTRLLFDGGNYSEAEKILSQINTRNLNSKNLVEFYYRSGRIKQEQDSFDLAIKEFENVIQLQDKSNYYYAPNAALQIALISEQNKNYQKAEEFFKKAYSYKSHEYKNSIQQKAKAGLRRIQNI